MTFFETGVMAFLLDLTKFLPMLLNLIFIEYLRKIIFLQADKKNTGKKTIYFMAIVAAVFIPIDTVMSVFECPEAWDFALSLGYVVLYLGSAIFFLVKGRERYKWLGAFSLIPLVGISDSFFGIWDIPKILIGLDGVEADVYQLCTIFLMLLVFLLFTKWKPSFFTHLEQDIETRSLSFAEESGIWLVGIWLMIFDVLITVDSVNFTSIYIRISNFIVAAVIIVLILDSNYRRFYYVQNLNLQKTLISTMADLVENRDENTGGHIQRTAKYVEIIAQKLKTDGKYTDILTDEYIKDMVVAAPLHDVGKINIPDAILNKPGRLSEGEFDVMKKHTSTGGEIIDKVIEEAGEIKYLEVAEKMAEYHHEKVDGSGYPHGLKGDEIPLCARIMAVSDVFDALVSKRCYKEAMSIEKAFIIIEQESGSHFDTDVANAFISARSEVEEFLSSYEKFEENTNENSI